MIYAPTQLARMAKTTMVGMNEKFLSVVEAKGVNAENIIIASKRALPATSAFDTIASPINPNSKKLTEHSNKNHKTDSRNKLFCISQLPVYITDNKGVL